MLEPRSPSIGASGLHEIRRSIDFYRLLMLWPRNVIRDSTSPFTNLERLNPSCDAPKLHKFRRSADFEALQMGKGSSGRNLTRYELPKSALNFGSLVVKASVLLAFTEKKKLSSISSFFIFRYCHKNKNIGRKTTILYYFFVIPNV